MTKKLIKLIVLVVIEAALISVAASKLYAEPRVFGKEKITVDNYYVDAAFSNIKRNERRGGSTTLDILSSQFVENEDDCIELLNRLCNNTMEFTEVKGQPADTFVVGQIGPLTKYKATSFSRVRITTYDSPKNPERVTMIWISGYAKAGTAPVYSFVYSSNEKYDFSYITNRKNQVLITKK